jgi:hypothetical protein
MGHDIEKKFTELLEKYTYIEFDDGGDMDFELNLSTPYTMNLGNIGWCWFDPEYGYNSLGNKDSLGYPYVDLL